MKTSLILGASRGLGKSITDLCQARGDYTIEVSSRVLDSRDSRRARYRCNLSNLSMVLSCINYLNSFEIDNFFWVAGQFLRGDFASHSYKDLIKTIDVNFRNPLFIAQYIWQRFQAKNSASNFCVVSSISGIKPSPLEAVYDATKHASVGLTRALGQENTNQKLHVCLVLPGSMKTDMQRQYPRGDFDSLLDPNKVAERIIFAIDHQLPPFLELTIPRGSF